MLLWLEDIGILQVTRRVLNLPKQLFAALIL